MSGLHEQSSQIGICLFEQFPHEEPRRTRGWRGRTAKFAGQP